jgi:hypothetical protein
MEQLPLLDIVIGLFLVYTFLSVLSTALTEFAIELFRWRAKTLRHGILNLLGELLEVNQNPARFNHTITGRLYKSPLIASIVQNDDRHDLSTKLSSISAETFANALLNVLQDLSQENSLGIDQKSSGILTVEKLKDAIEFAPELSALLKANLKRMLEHVQAITPDPKQQIVELKLEIAQWFNHARIDTLNAYKYRIKILSLIISLVISVGVNADSLYLIRSISENTATRAIVIQNPKQIQGCRANLGSPACIKNVSVLMEKSTFPVGWQSANRQRQFPKLTEIAVLKALGGWLITGIAISMGSRFWFQLMNKLINWVAKRSG